MKIWNENEEERIEKKNTKMKIQNKRRTQQILTAVKRQSSIPKMLTTKKRFLISQKYTTPKEKWMKRWGKKRQILFFLSDQD